MYAARRGSTDSELLFLLMLANGLDTSPKTASETAISLIRSAQGEIGQPNRMTCVFSDGRSLFSFRYSSDRKSPTLYLSDTLDNQGRAVASCHSRPAKNNAHRTDLAQHRMRRSTYQ